MLLVDSFTGLAHVGWIMILKSTGKFPTSTRTSDFLFCFVVFFESSSHVALGLTM